MVYQLSLPAEKALALNSRRLAKVEGLADFDKLLRGLGDAKLLYRIDQTVNLREHKEIETEADQPFPAGRSHSSGKRPVMVVRRRTSLELTASGDWLRGAAGRIAMLSLEIELSAAEAAGDNTGCPGSPIFRAIRQTYAAPTGFEQPVILINLDGLCTDVLGRCVAYITRVVPHRPPTQGNSHGRRCRTVSEN